MYITLTASKLTKRQISSNKLCYTLYKIREIWVLAVHLTTEMISFNSVVHMQIQTNSTQICSKVRAKPSRAQVVLISDGSTIVWILSGTVNTQPVNCVEYQIAAVAFAPQITLHSRLALGKQPRRSAAENFHLWRLLRLFREGSLTLALVVIVQPA